MKILVKNISRHFGVLALTILTMDCSSQKKETETPGEHGIYESLSDSLSEAIYTDYALVESLDRSDRRYKNTDLPDSVKEKVIERNAILRKRAESDIQSNKEEYRKVTGEDWKRVE